MRQNAAIGGSADKDARSPSTTYGGMGDKPREKQ
jgi:hypothetical protein